MKKEDYKDAMAKLDLQMQEIGSLKNKLKDEYILLNKRFDVGDRVKIINGSSKNPIRYGFVNRVKVGYNGDIEYIILKEKKDGNPSMVKDCVWNGEVIEAIQ